MTLACVVLAHADPIHVRRLVAALEPFPVYLHCDSRTSPSVYAEMTDGLPSRCPGICTGISGTFLDASSVCFKATAS